MHEKVGENVIILYWQMAYIINEQGWCFVIRQELFRFLNTDMSLNCKSEIIGNVLLDTTWQ